MLSRPQLFCSEILGADADARARQNIRSELAVLNATVAVEQTAPPQL
jgi:predicted metal-dependent HD superfamily phosphohydrolase